MVVELVSLVALSIILAALAVGWSRRFLAVGALAVANIVVFLLTILGPRIQVMTSSGPALRSAIHHELGLHGDQLVAYEPIAFLNVLTSMFVHADIWHIFGNLLTLLAFALPFEERIGPRRFLLLYLASGVVGAVVQVWFTGGAPILMMGASAAVFGILGAFAARFPHQVISVPLPLPIIIFLRMRVIVAALIFAAIQVVYLVLPANPFDNTAYQAHLGGLAAGILLVFVVVGRQFGTSHEAGNGSVMAGARRLGASRTQEAGGGRGRRSKHVHIDIHALMPFAQDSGTKRALDNLKDNQDEPDLWHAWLDRFFQTAKCPDCDSQVQPEPGGFIACSLGHRYDVREGQPDREAGRGKRGGNGGNGAPHLQA